MPRDCVVSIEIADAVIEQRMTGRRVCTACGASYHVTANPPKADGICDHCGRELSVRKDDAPETVKNRLKVFHSETEALKGFYEKLGKLKLVNGDPDTLQTDHSCFTKHAKILLLPNADA